MTTPTTRRRKRRVAAAPPPRSAAAAQLVMPASARRRATSLPATAAPQSATGQKEQSLSTVHDTLLETLMGLPYDAFARCVARLLERMDYMDVALAGRINYRGRTPQGGFDLTALRRHNDGVFPRPVIIQAKQFAPTQLVYQRTIDELRGTCLRVGASEALLITTSDFSPSIRANTDKQPGVISPPIRLVNGRTLTDLMIRCKVGVRYSSAGGRKVNIDSTFFDELCRKSRGNRPADCGRSPIVVTVCLQRVPRKGQRRAAVAP